MMSPPHRELTIHHGTKRGPLDDAYRSLATSTYKSGCITISTSKCMTVTAGNRNLGDALTLIDSCRLFEGRQ
jgi:hypothetical protein